MTPREKALDLICSFESKKFALIATQQVIDTLYEYHYDSASGAFEYWTEVKEELEKL